jgi:hypothetical protein
MTDETTVDISDDLDAFSKDFFNPTAKETDSKVEAVDEEVTEDEDVDTDENPVANEEDTDAEDETDDETSEEEPDEDESDEEHKDSEEDKTPKGKKNRKSARERIEELVTEARVAQREAEALRRRIEQLETRTPHKEETQEEKTVALRDQLSADAPSPDAVDEKGEPVYPLGEFDPTYIRDLTKFTIAQERKAIQEQEAQEKAAQELATAQTELQQTWLTNLEKAKKDLPDIQEKLVDLEPVVKNIDPEYGDFLAATLMASEYGPQIMYYLAENIDEAQSIVASGPASATRAIGRLEARFESSTNRSEKQRNTNKRVSDAPTPPEARTKGNRGTSHVRPDTDDLDAFSREFFGKK